jgi:crotonobetainyl-CoA:carnitine CoA-transferase CaiB-like acyl-CoA transferase
MPRGRHPHADAGALAGLAVLDLSDDLAGAYSTKILADLGADVVMVEPPGGAPLRRWSASGALGRDGDRDGALFRYLAASKRSVAADLDDRDGLEGIRRLAADADVVVESFTPGRLDDLGLGFGDLRDRNRAVVLVSISPYGQAGGASSGPANEFLLQALSGSTFSRGEPGDVPLALGGRVGLWTGGAYAALGALTAHRRSRVTGNGEHVDVSLLECIAATLVGYGTLAASFPGGLRGRLLWPQVPSIEPCKDGYVGLFTVTGQQWLDFLAMIEQPAMAEDTTLATAPGRAGRIDEVRRAVHEWTLARTADEIVELASMFRVPAALIGNGENMPHMDHLVERESFGTNARGGFVQPRSPFRFSRTPTRPPEPAPTVGQHQAVVFTHADAGKVITPASGRWRSNLPLSDVRVLDLTAFWAGPFATLYLATMGADVIKVEGAGRPDPIRYSAFLPPDTPNWIEQSTIGNAANLGKRGISLDLSRPEGRDLALRLVEHCDVVIENFTPRVMDQFGLSYEELRSRRPDVILVRLPAFGLSGPWRDRPGFATTVEQVAGLAWINGYRDGPPMAPGGMCDPLAGAHALIGILAALDHRDRTREGQQLEMAMVDVGINVAAEQVIEYSAYGELLTRAGNRSPDCAPQGVYPCLGAERWVALSVTTDAEWDALVAALDWAPDPMLSSAAGRRAAHDRLDGMLSTWCASRDLDEVLRTLAEHGVPAAPVVPSYTIDEDPQLRARGFFCEVTHPVVGTHAYPGWPMRFSAGPSRWYEAPAPLFGQHTDDVLREQLGLGEEEIEKLRGGGVIGPVPSVSKGGTPT